MNSCQESFTPWLLSAQLCVSGLVDSCVLLSSFPFAVNIIVNVHCFITLICNFLPSVFIAV